MELKVWVEGIQRIVCGVTVNTTCQDVVFALAHATGKVGRFTLIERWRNNERHLAPNENPLKLLLKWGEYANDVQFILQRSENKQQQQQQQQANQTTTSNNALKKPLGLSNTNNNNSNNNNTNSNNNTNNSLNNSSNNNNMNKESSSIPNVLPKQKSSIELGYKTRELKKSFGAYDAKHIENIGIVKGIPQQQQTKSTTTNAASAKELQQQQQQKSRTTTTNNNYSAHNSPVPQQTPLIPKHEKSHSNPIEMSSSNMQASTHAYNNYYNYNNNNNNNNSNNNNNNNVNYNNNIYSQLGAQHSKSTNEINLAEVRSALDRRTTSNNNKHNINITSSSSHSPIDMYNNNNINNNNNNMSHENLIDIYANTNANNNNNNNTTGNNTPYNASPDLYRQTPTISANGALVPPPYRDPPPPRNSPMQRSNADTISNSSSSTTTTHAVTPTQQQQQLSQTTATANLTQNPFLSDYNCNNDYEYELKQHYVVQRNDNNVNANMDMEGESIFQTTQYTDLLQLIKFQREKISAQQMELNKFDAEIVFLETKERDQAQELEAISREITKADQIFRQGSDQTLQYVEEENELVKQQEKTLKSEITLLRSKLTNCETELLQCKNKIRILMDDIEMEQRGLTQKQKNNRQNVERDFLIEMERIQSEIDQALHNTDASNKTTDNLKKELIMIENAIAEKKRQVEQLVNEMKEVNLQSLTVTTSEEIKHLFEGHNKQGSSRRIIGSPRQLENAVPTSKNPHGVWV